MRLTDELQPGQLPGPRLGDVDGAGADVAVDVAAGAVQEGQGLGDLQGEGGRRGGEGGGKINTNVVQ